MRPVIRAARRNAVMGAANVMDVARMSDVQTWAGGVGMVLLPRSEGRLTKRQDGDAHGEQGDGHEVFHAGIVTQIRFFSNLFLQLFC